MCVRNSVMVLVSGVLLLVIDGVIAAPVPTMREEKDIVLMPVPMAATGFAQVPMAVNPVPVPQSIDPSSPYQTRGPFQFIGQWIQQTPWLPIEFNVPDFFQNIGTGINQATNNIQQLSQNVGTGVSQIGQNVGQGVTQLTQNVGTGLSQFTQNVGTGFNQWMQQLSQRFPFLANSNNNKDATGTSSQHHQLVVMFPMQYPGGQQLVLEEAIESYP